MKSRRSLCKLCFLSPAIALALTFNFFNDYAAANAQALVSRSAAHRAGLERAWFTVAEVDRSRGRLAGVLADGDLLFVLTNQGALQAFDAETGGIRWTTHIGRAGTVNLGPAANEKFVAAVNGSTVYVVDRKTGKKIFNQKLSGGAGAGPCLTQEHVFVPLVTGKMEGFALGDSEIPRWNHQSVGRSLVQPIATPYSIAWTTDRGYVYHVDPVTLDVRFRIETQDAISTPPTALSPYIFAASQDGFIYAANEKNGTQLWRYSLGEAISTPPVAVMQRVFVCSEKPEMVCVSAKEGLLQWKAKGISRFVAASPTKVYAFDSSFRLHVLDGATGKVESILKSSTSTFPVVNQKTDRIYLASPTGVIQCLRELQAKEPHKYNRMLETDNPKEEKKKEAGEADAAEEEGDNQFEEDAADAAAVFE